MEIKILVTIIYDALSDFVPFVQFKKCEKHLWKFISATKLNVCETFGSDRALALYFDLEQLSFTFFWIL